MNTLLVRLEPHVEKLGAVTLGLIYLALTNGHLHSIDGLLMYYEARAIAFNHSLWFPVPIWWGGLFSSTYKGLGLSLLYVPSLEMWSWLLPNTPPIPSPGVYSLTLLYSDPLYTVAIAPINMALTALTAYLVARFVRVLGYDRGTAIWGLATFGVASPAIVYAREDFEQPLEAACWTAALLSALSYQRTGQTRHLVASCLCLIYAVLTRPVEGSLLAPGVILLAVGGLGPWPWKKPWDAWRKCGIVVLAYSVALAATAASHWYLYGSPLATGYGPVSWSTPLSIGVPSALLSPGRGIIEEYPLVLLLPIGFSHLWRSRQRLVACTLAGLATVLLIEVSTWSVWWGGWNWGLRLFLPALPLLAVLVSSARASFGSSGTRWLCQLLAVGGIVWAIPCIVTDFMAGYAGDHNDTLSNWRLDAYPPIGAWQYLRHVFSTSLLDHSGVDIFWVRLAHDTANLSLIPLVVLTLAAGMMGGLVILIQSQKISSQDPRANGHVSIIQGAID